MVKSAADALSGLRPYQVDLTNLVVDFLKKAINSNANAQGRYTPAGWNLNVLVGAATGAGKSCCAVAIMSWLREQGYQCYFIVSMQPLIGQMIDTFDWFQNDTPGVIKAGMDDYIDSSNPYQLAMLQTIDSRGFPSGLNPKKTCFIFDEAHVQYDFQKKVMSAYPESIFLGFTATPNRLSKKQSLNHLYCELITTDEVTTKNLVKIGTETRFTQGLVVPLSYTVPERLNLETVSKSAGDYKVGGADGLSTLMLNDVKSTESLLDQMEGFFQWHKTLEKINARDLNQKYIERYNLATTTDEQKAIIQDVLTYWNGSGLPYELGSFRRFIYFCVSKDHVNQVADLTSQRNLLTYGVTANTKEGTRDLLYDMLADGLLHGLIAIDVLSTGFDVKEIEMVVIARATMSIAKFIQMAGRGLRICPRINKRDCVLLDQAGNMSDRHGLPEEYEPMFDDGDPDRQPGEAPAKICPECECVNRASARDCTGCGYHFPPKIKEPQTAQLKRALDKKQKKLRAMYFRCKSQGLPWQAILNKVCAQVNNSSKDGTPFQVKDFDMMTESQWFGLLYDEMDGSIAWKLKDFTGYLVSSYAITCAVGKTSIDESTKEIMHRIKMEFGSDIFDVNRGSNQDTYDWMFKSIYKLLDEYCAMMQVIAKALPKRQTVADVMYHAGISTSISNNLNKAESAADKQRRFSDVVQSVASLHSSPGQTLTNILTQNPDLKSTWITLSKRHMLIDKAYNLLNDALDQWS